MQFKDVRYAMSFILKRSIQSCIGDKSRRRPSIPWAVDPECKTFRTSPAYRAGKWIFRYHNFLTHPVYHVLPSIFAGPEKISVHLSWKALKNLLCKTRP